MSSDKVFVSPPTTMQLHVYIDIKRPPIFGGLKIANFPKALNPIPKFLACYDLAPHWRPHPPWQPQCIDIAKSRTLTAQKC